MIKTRTFGLYLHTTRARHLYAEHTLYVYAAHIPDTIRTRIGCTLCSGALYVSDIKKKKEKRDTEKGEKDDSVCDSRSARNNNTISSAGKKKSPAASQRFRIVREHGTRRGAVLPTFGAVRTRDTIKYLTYTYARRCIGARFTSLYAIRVRI